MTDRRTGGLGANVDIRVNPQRRTGGLGVSADLIVASQRRTGTLGAMVDLAQLTGVRMTGGLGAMVDLLAPAPPPPLLPLVRWPGSGSIFQITGSATPTHWQSSTKQLQTSLLDLPLLQWDATLKRFVLPDSLEDLYYDGEEHLSYAGLENLLYGG